MSKCEQNANDSGRRHPLGLWGKSLTLKTRAFPKMKICSGVSANLRPKCDLFPASGTQQVSLVKGTHWYPKWLSLSNAWWMDGEGPPIGAGWLMMGISQVFLGMECLPDTHVYASRRSCARAPSAQSDYSVRAVRWMFGGLAGEKATTTLTGHHYWEKRRTKNFPPYKSRQSTVCVLSSPGAPSWRTPSVCARWISSGVESLCPRRKWTK